MPIATGTRLGPFEILSLIGKGGMGEVYRAKDTTLKREVALKVLPEGFLADPERMMRFQREAELLAALNHPNIAAIHGLAHGALIMELVVGESLPVRIPLDTALNYALQIAVALEYAHAQGVVHRDLKPANIMVTSDGVVKLLDFGLAKAVEGPASSGGGMEDSPTLTLAHTQAGVVLGTAAYMSPEQAAGKSVDRRSDIWSFGVILFQILTGRRPFDGDSIAEILASVMKDEPDFEALPEATPMAIRKLVRRCLTKDRKKRLQAIGEARIVLEAPPADEAPAPIGISWPWVALSAVLAMVSAGALWMLWKVPKSPEAPTMRLAFVPGGDYQPVYQGSASVVLSPDGKTLAYLGSGSDGRIRITVRRLNEEQSTVIAESAGALQPFFSPDGRSIGFFATGKLKKAALPGGAVTVICDSAASSGASWGEDGYIIAALAHTTHLSRVSENGGTPEPITKTTNELTHRWPQVLPGAKAFLFTANEAGLGYNDARIEVQSLKDGQRKTLVRGGHFGRYAASGHLLYVRQGVLYAAPMDLGRLELTGPAVRIDTVASNLNGGAQYDVSLNGTMVLLPPHPQERQLVWLDRKGEAKPLRPAADYIMSIAFSPDGGKVAYTIVEAGNADIWVDDLSRGTSQRLTSSPAYDAFPVWAPDGKHIAFTSARHGGAQTLYWIRADGSNDAIRLTDSPFPQLPSSFSPDGRRLAFTQVEPETSYDLWTLPLDEPASDQPKAGKPEVFSKNRFQEGDASFSPDGKWLAFRSNESGKEAIYVRPFPAGNGGKWQVSGDGFFCPRWAKSRNELMFFGETAMMAAEFKSSGGEFLAGRPRLWAKLPGPVSHRYFDIAPGGERIVFGQEVMLAAQKVQAITVIVNLFDELNRLAH